MLKKSGNISLSSYDDIFQTDQSREESQQERVQEIPLSELHPFKGHPFKVLDDDAMQKTVESIAQFGVMTPAIARPRPEGGYELIAGHRYDFDGGLQFAKGNYSAERESFCL